MLELVSEKQDVVYFALTLYAGDTADKLGYFSKDELASLGIQVDSHGKMPDVVIYFAKRNWLLFARL